MNQLLLSFTIGISSPSPFASLRAGVTAPVPSPAPIRVSLPAGQPDRLGNAVLGAVIGGAAGIVTCTVISNIVKDSGTGFSTCTWKGYLLLGGSGAGLGALIGALAH